MKFSKALYPILSFVLSVIFWIVVLFQKNLVAGIALLLAWLVLLIPILSFLYSRVYLKNSKNKFLYTLLISFSFAFAYLILFFRDGETYLYALLMFAWSELWALLGMIGHNRAKE